VNIKTYVVTWGSVHEGLADILSQINNYSVINSDAPEQENWHNLGMVWYYKQMHFALSDFVENNSEDIFCWLAGDISSQEFKKVYSQARIAFKDKNNAIYAPHVSHEAWSKDAVFLQDYKSGMAYSSQTDGIFVFMSREHASLIKEYMDYLDSKEDLVSMRSGWGLDYVWCSLAIYNKKYILRDSSVKVIHPPGSSYNHDKANQEMSAVMNRLGEFCDIKNIDKEKVGKICNKISLRMAKRPNTDNLDCFYLDEINIPYTIVSINDNRIENKNNIREVLKDKKELDIEFLNATDVSKLDNFLATNKDFHITWDSFKLGEIGCFGSHYTAWQNLLKSKDEYLLILEDDAFLEENFITIVSKLFNQVPKDFDFFSIYVDENQSDRYKKSMSVSDDIALAYQDWSTLGYIVSKSGAKKALNYVKKHGMNEPVDWFLFRNNENKKFKIYTPKPKVNLGLSIKDTNGSMVQGTMYLKDEGVQMARDFTDFIKRLGESKYSQIQQDIFALFVNKEKPGYFVEFGACDGVYLSNTYILEKEYGWNGILSEPIESYFKDLEKNRGCHVDNFCVSKSTGDLVDFTEVNVDSDMGLSGITKHASYDHHANTRKENSRKYKVETISLKDLLDKYDAPDIIDYLSIDTEGSELEILKSYDFSRKFKCITVEHNGTENREKIFSLLSSKGYDRILTEYSKWDDWYINKELL
jgi:FkbM family methyltransferase